MGFIDEAIEDSIGIWEKCANERFLNEIADGTMSDSKFLDYMIQDSLYLRGYLKMYATGMSKCRTWNEMKMFYEVLGYINDSENKTRLRYLAEAGMTDDDVDEIEKRPQCKAYTEFLFETGKNGDILDILVASMPCMLGYNYVFLKLVERAPQVSDGKYSDYVNDYVNDGFCGYVELWKSRIDAMCDSLDASRKEELMKIFRTGSKHELSFWQMAGEDR